MSLEFVSDVANFHTIIRKILMKKINFILEAAMWKMDQKGVSENPEGCGIFSPYFPIFVG